MACVLAQGGEPGKSPWTRLAGCRSSITGTDRSLPVRTMGRTGSRRPWKSKTGVRERSHERPQEINLGLLQDGPGGGEADPAVDAERAEGVLHCLQVCQVVAGEQRARCRMVGVPGLGLADDDGGEFRVLLKIMKSISHFARALGQLGPGEVEHSCCPLKPFPHAAWKTDSAAITGTVSLKCASSSAGIACIAQAAGR